MRHPRGLSYLRASRSTTFHPPVASAFRYPNHRTWLRFSQSRTPSQTFRSLVPTSLVPRELICSKRFKSRFRRGAFVPQSMQRFICTAGLSKMVGRSRQISGINVLSSPLASHLVSFVTTTSIALVMISKYSRRI